MTSMSAGGKGKGFDRGLLVDGGLYLLWDSRYLSGEMHQLYVVSTTRLAQVAAKFLGAKFIDNRLPLLNSLRWMLAIICWL